MTAVLYDEDRLPWLHDTAGAFSEETSTSAALLRGAGKGIFGAVLALIAVASVFLLLFELQKRIPDWLPPAPTEGSQSAAEAIDASACARVCAELGKADLPPSTDRAVAENGAGRQPVPRSQDNRQSAVRMQPPAVELQLGAYRDAAGARKGSGYLSGQFPWLRHYRIVVTPPSGQAEALFRLRLRVSSEEEAARLCKLIKQGGEDCFLVR